MKRTIINGLIASLSTTLLAACGGGTTDSSSSGSKMLATTAACYTPWVSTTAYNGGATVSYASVNYTAAYWTQNQNPSTNNGPSGSGQPWISNGACGTSPTPTPAPTPTPTPAPTPTPTPTPTPAPTPTPTPAPTPTPTPAPTPTPTPAPTPTPTPAPTPAPTPTGTCPQYVDGHTYATGDKVTNVGNYYQCTVGGWCSTGGAYAPGTGWAWTNAWNQITASQCGGTPTPAPTPTPTPTPAPTPTPTPAPTPTPTPAPTPASGTTGTVNFHLLLGVSTGPQDHLTLDGDNYTDLIMSNMVAGVMYGHLVQEGYPGIQFNKDYLYGSIMGQLLQENLATFEYQASTNLIDPGADQQAVMGAGQGGPYQINNYAVDMVDGGSNATGHSLVNYVAIQKNIGYTIAGQPAQASKTTPPSFNNKYYGPVLTAYFHYNDFIALIVTGKSSGWVTPWQPDYDNALANFKNLPNSFLDMILNVAYNQGFYGGLVSSYSKQGETATPSTVASVNSYSSVWGNSSTYVQYPYQVHYYMDQIYGNPIPTTSPTTFTTPPNHVIFGMQQLASVFSNVFQTLAYVNSSGQYVFISSAQANAAFNAALSKVGVSSTASLDLSNASQRAQIFGILENAVGGLESSLGTTFNATTTTQL